MTETALLTDETQRAAAAPTDPAALAEAFRLFNQASGELSRAYEGLQAQVAQLTAELAAANGEKAALTERLARNERLAAMGEMVAGLAHQLRTPLSAALLHAANLAAPGLDTPMRERAATRVVERLQHLETLIRDMLVFARGEIGSRTLLRIEELTAEVAQICDPIARGKGVEFLALAEAGEAMVWVSRADVVGALTNLIDNAIGAVEAGGLVALDAEVDASSVTFCICDNGPGIAPELQKRLFEPFFTTRAQGTGLGLAIARGVARAHGGDLELRPGRDHGRWTTEFRLSLPRAAASTNEGSKQ